MILKFTHSNGEIVYDNVGCYRLQHKPFLKEEVSLNQVLLRNSIYDSDKNKRDLFLVVEIIFRSPMKVYGLDYDTVWVITQFNGWAMNDEGKTIEKLIY